jgi:hypothetical protein
MRITALLWLGLALSSDLLSGSWKADLGASTLPPDLAKVRSQTMQLHMESGKLQCSTERITSAGGKSRADFTASFDGKRYPVTGAANIKAVSLKRNAERIDATFYSDTAAVFRYRMEVSRGGRTLVVTSLDPATGQVLHAKVIYRRD